MPQFLSAVAAPLLAINEYHLFGLAGAISLAAFVGLILLPALGSYGRPWEKFAAGFLSLFVLVALVLAGLAIGVFVFYEWDQIADFF
jgi:hypothetical protein